MIAQIHEGTSNNNRLSTLLPEKSGNTSHKSNQALKYHPPSKDDEWNMHHRVASQAARAKSTWYAQSGRFVFVFPRMVIAFCSTIPTMPIKSQRAHQLFGCLTFLLCWLWFSFEISVRHQGTFLHVQSCNIHCRGHNVSLK